MSHHLSTPALSLCHAGACARRAGHRHGPAVKPITGLPHPHHTFCAVPCWFSAFATAHGIGTCLGSMMGTHSRAGQAAQTAGAPCPSHTACGSIACSQSHASAPSILARGLGTCPQLPPSNFSAGRRPHGSHCARQAAVHMHVRVTSAWAGAQQHITLCGLQAPLRTRLLMNDD